MKIAHLTDIHLDHMHPRDVTSIAREALKGLDPSVPVMITGDIAAGNSLYLLGNFLEATIGNQIYFILGNHDAWLTSVADSHRAAANFARKRRNLTYLPGDGTVWLAPGTALVGLDGWYDMRVGNVNGTSVYLNDFRYIKDFDGLHRDRIREIVQERGAKCARRAREILDDALANYNHVVFATHVPPFVQAAKYQGKPTDADHLPFYVNFSLGLALESAAASHPDKKITVLCGHTHDACDVQIADNLRCVVGAAEYERIILNVVEV